MAKGAEDRSFYRYLRLASLCEVGGDPGRFGAPVEEFHADNLRRAGRDARAMLASSTHHTKRSEDVRARSAALTWLVADPDAEAALSGWVGELAGRSGVDAVGAWLAAQTAITTPDLDVDRLHAYLVKASREAATFTEWADPDADYEDRLRMLAELAISADPPVRSEVDGLAPGVSLAATTLRLTSPGVPDIYQGTEAFSFRLVDPDNRVPPDWAELDRFVDDGRSVAELWAQNDPGVKTALVRDVLGLRRRHPHAFAAGYRPIDGGDGVVAFVRGDDVVVAVRRGAAQVAAPFELPPGAWHDVLDPMAPMLAGTVDAAVVVGTGTDQTLPVAVFERD